MLLDSNEQHVEFVCIKKITDHMVALNQALNWVENSSLSLSEEVTILDSGFAEKVCGISLLKQGVTDVFFVTQNLIDDACPPFGYKKSTSEEMLHLKYY